MSPSQRRAAGDLQTRFWLWTIHRQSFLARHFVLYIWAAVAATIFFAFIGRFSMESAMYGIFIGGTTILFILWVLIERRKTWLLRISDPEVKQKAYEAMLMYMKLKGLLEGENGYSWDTRTSDGTKY